MSGIDDERPESHSPYMPGDPTGYEEALMAIATYQPQVLEMVRGNSLQDMLDPDLVVGLYNYICEIDVIARKALNVQLESDRVLFPEEDEL
jgi:hypothetical protein